MLERRRLQISGLNLFGHHTEHLSMQSKRQPAISEQTVLIFKQQVYNTTGTEKKTKQNKKGKLY